MSWKSCAKKIPGPGSCEAPYVKSRSQNWDPTSWKSHPKSFQVSILETANVKIQAPKLRSQVLKPYPKISQAPKLKSQVLKTMSWKSYPKISHAPKLKSQVLKTMSWKPYPKISQVFLGLGNLECKLQVSKNWGSHVLKISRFGSWKPTPCTSQNWNLTSWKSCP